MTREEWLALEFPPTAMHAHRRARFMRKIEVVDDPDACWTWRASTKGSGYGQFSMGVRPVGAHRVAWEMANGRPIPPGLFGLHRCGNGHLGCVRPSHVYAGTQKQNGEDATRHGRTCRGEKSPRAKLTEAGAKEVIRAAIAGEAASVIAERVGTSRSLIYAIVDGDSWPHIDRPANLGATWRAARRAAGRVIRKAGLVIRVDRYKGTPQRFGPKRPVDDLINELCRKRAA